MLLAYAQKALAGTGLKYGLSLYLHPYYVYARSCGFGESVYLHRHLRICTGSLKPSLLEIAVSYVLPGFKDIEI